MLSTILEPKHWPAGEGKIILTFDDGPNPNISISNQLLDVLKSHQIPATFCYIGRNIKKHPAIVKRAIDENHSVAYHTYSHTPWPLLSKKRLLHETDKTQKLFKTITKAHNKSPKLFRPPWGIVTPAVKHLLKELSLDTAYLTFFISEAWSDPASGKQKMDQIKKRLLKNKGGAIVLHENCHSVSIDKSWLPDAVENLILWAKEHQLTFTSYDTKRI
ncbi:MAG: polysaccharide deacetylase family protein [Verrucomicrobiota bacterium]